MTKRAKIYSNDSSKPITELVIKAQSNSPNTKFKTDPRGIKIGDLFLGKEAKYHMTLTDIDSGAVELSVINPPSTKYVKRYTIKSPKLKPQQSTQIEFDLRGDIPPGDFLTCLTLEEKNRPDTRITIPISGKVVGTVPLKK